MKKFFVILLVALLALSQFALADGDMFCPAEFVNSYNAAVEAVINVFGEELGYDEDDIELLIDWLEVEYLMVSDGRIMYTNDDLSFAIIFDCDSKWGTATTLFGSAQTDSDSILGDYPLQPFMYAVGMMDGNDDGFEAMMWASDLSDEDFYFGEDYIAMSSVEANDTTSILVVAN